MTSKRYLIQALALSAAMFGLIWGLFIVYNIHRDEYGMFGRNQNCMVNSVTQERLEKHIMAYRYIPENFDGVIFGPSFSSNINTNQMHPFKVYNASVNGINISEMRIIIDTALDHNQRIKFIVLCLDPYLTLKSGLKSEYLNSNDYWRAYASADLLSRYIDLMNQRPVIADSYGYYDYCRGRSNEGVRETILDMAQNGTPLAVQPDPYALADLQAIIDHAHQCNVRVLAYFYPRPYAIYDKNRENYDNYVTEIRALFSPEDAIWNYNIPEYRWISENYDNYIDYAHLSFQGAELVGSDMEKRINQAMNE